MTNRKPTTTTCLKKKNESKMATSMELLQQGERFRIVDPPSYPQRPEFPNRLKFCAMGLGIGRAWVCSSPGPLSSWMTACTTPKTFASCCRRSHRRDSGHCEHLRRPHRHSQGLD